MFFYVKKNQQEELCFEEGFVQVLLPKQAVLGIEFRQSNSN